jgi:hypothetical protein
MKVALRILVEGWLLFHVLVASAEIPVERIDQYMALSGIDEMLTSMPLQIEATIDQLLLASEQPEAERRLMTAMIGAWDKDAVRATVEEYIRKASNPSEMDSLLAWKVSPLAKTMMAAEMESYAPAFQQDLGRYTVNLRENPPDEETARAISRLVSRAHIADLMVESTVQSTRAMAMALIEAGMVGSDSAVADLGKELDVMRKQLAPHMRRQATLMSFYIYRDISNDELDRYSDYYQSDLGRRELALAYGAMEAAMFHWMTASADILSARPRGVE